MTCTPADIGRGKRCPDNKKEIIEVVETQAFQAAPKHEEGAWGRRVPVSRHNAGFAGAVLNTSTTKTSTPCKSC